MRIESKHFIRNSVLVNTFIIILTLAIAVLIILTPIAFDISEAQLVNASSDVYKPLSISEVRVLLEQVSEPSNPSNPGNPPVPGNPGNLLPDYTKSDVYIKLLNSVYASKAYALAAVYEKASLISKELAIGLMANVYAEGNAGVVEYSFSSDHHYGFQLPSEGSVISTRADIEYLKAWPTTQVHPMEGKLKEGSCGLGMIQWSFERRVSLCNLYLQYDANYTSEVATTIEIEYMLQELLGPYKAVASKCVPGTTPEDCAEIITREYAKPSKMDEEVTKRRQCAAGLLQVLK